jgi:hypothetical protein
MMDQLVLGETHETWINVRRAARARGISVDTLVYLFERDYPVPMEKPVKSSDVYS